MPELKELVERGKAKLVGIGRPTERKQFEVETTEDITLPQEGEGPMTVKFVGVRAVKGQAITRAHEQMTQKPKPEESRRKSIAKSPGRIARNIWNTVARTPHEYRERQHQEEYLRKLKNNVFTNEIIDAARQKAEDDYANESKLGQAKIRLISKEKYIHRQTLVHLAATSEEVLQNAQKTQQREFTATASRIQNFEDVRKELGEDVFELDKDNETHKPLIKDLQDLMSEYATTGLSKEEFDRRGALLYEQIKALDPAQRIQVDLWSTSYFKAAEALRTEALQGKGVEAVEKLIASARFRIAFGVMGAASTIEPTIVDKVLGSEKMGRFIQWSSKHAITHLMFNEVTIGTAVARATTAAPVMRGLVGKGARIFSPVLGSVAGGIFAARRERATLGSEYRLIQQQLEAGVEGALTGRRREKIGKYAVDKVSAQEMTGKLQTMDINLDPRTCADYVALVQARINLSAQRDKKGHTTSHINYTSRETIESERAGLYKALRDAKHALKAMDENVLKQALEGSSLEDYLTVEVSEKTKELRAQSDIQQKGFQKFARTEAVKHGAAAATVGIIGSEIFADAFNWIKTGHFEGVGPIGAGVKAVGRKVGILHEGKPTAVETLASRARFGTEHWQPFGVHDTTLPGGQHIAGTAQAIHTEIPNGARILTDGNGAYKLVSSDGTMIARHLKFDTNGRLIKPPDWAQQVNRLKTHGFSLRAENHQLPSVDVGATDTGTFDINVGQMANIAGDHGYGGETSWLQKVMETQALAQGQNVHHIQPATNLADKLFQAYEKDIVHNSNVSIPGHPVPSILDYTKLPNDATFGKLPTAYFSPEALAKINNVMNEALQYEHAPGFISPEKWASMDELHKLAFQIGRRETFFGGYDTQGNIIWVQRTATKEEVLRFFDLLGAGHKETITPFRSTFILEKLIETPKRGIPISTPPPIVTPLYPHAPLEGIVATTAALGTPSTPFYFGYGGYGGSGGFGSLESWVQYGEWLKSIDKMPPLVPSEGTRNVAREQQRIKTYLNSLSTEEKERLDNFSQELPKMERDCRIAVIIPAYHEESGIYHTLEEWANQKDNNDHQLNPNLYEVNILINREEGTPPDRTLDEVQRFNQDHPQIRVNVIDFVFPKGKGGVGAARKLITDLTLRRSAERGNIQRQSLYIESEDADLLEIDRKAIFNLIRKFDGNPQLDALRGKQDLAPQIIKEHDYLFFERRVERFSEYLLRDHRLRPEINPDADSRWNTIVLGGWNSAYTAEAYALIGGYQPVRIGEDVDIGSRISLMRGTKTSSGTIIPNTKVVDTVRNIGQSNPRRFIYALVTGRHAYHTFGDKDIDEAIRSKNPQALLQQVKYGHRIDYSNKNLFEDILTNNLVWLRRVIKDPILQKKLESRLMTVLGFSKFKDITRPDGTIERLNGSLSEKETEGWKLDYHLDQNGRVVIDNIENIARALEQYRQRT